MTKWMISLWKLLLLFRRRRRRGRRGRRTEEGFGSDRFLPTLCFNVIPNVLFCYWKIEREGEMDDG
jgi:hypothetical protein